MALQDMPDVPAVLRAVHAVLRPDGRFVASITHPCTDMPFREWRRDESGRKLRDLRPRAPRSLTTLLKRQHSAVILSRRISDWTCRQ
jgi:hypothetical protein